MKLRLQRYFCLGLVVILIVGMAHHKFAYAQQSEKNMAGLVAIVYSALMYTQEKHAHQLHGEIGNVVYLHKDGLQEQVINFPVDKNGNVIEDKSKAKMVTDCLNKGSPNYAHPRNKPLDHFALDTAPWIMYGNCKEDPSTKKERLDAFIQDFSDGLGRVISQNNGLLLPDKPLSESQEKTILFFIKVMGKSFDQNKFIDQRGNFIPQKHQEFIRILRDGLSKEML